MPSADGLTGPAMKSCLGAAFYNFGGMYVRLLDGIHRGRWDASKFVLEPMTEVAETLDPHSADVDALVPDGDVAPPPDLLGAPGAPPGTGFKCSENL